MSTEPPLYPAEPTFDDFYRDSYTPVLGHALWLIRNRGDAEDVTQEAFLAAHRNWGRLRSLDWPQGWVQRVVSNRSVSRYRGVMREARARASLDHAELRRRSVVAEDVADIWDAVAQLPKRQAQVIALQYGCGYTVAQIAEILHCTTETVKTHATRARSTLAVTLGEPE